MLELEPDTKQLLDHISRGPGGGSQGAVMRPCELRPEGGMMLERDKIPIGIAETRCQEVGYRARST